MGGRKGKRTDSVTSKGQPVGGDARGVLEEAYEQYAADLYRYALMILADHGLAEDAVQQAFMKTMRLGERIRHIASSNGYLRAAVRNECYGILKKRRRLGRALRLLPSQAILDKANVDTAHDAERQVIERTIRQLPPEQREVLHAKVYEDQTFRQIAETTGVSVNTVASRYRYAINALRDACLGRGGKGPLS